MSLETLLEAAEFIEWRSKEEEPCHFHPYAKKASAEPIKVEPSDSSQSFDFDEDEEDLSRERRRPGGAGTREVHNKLEKNRGITLFCDSDLLFNIRKAGRAHLKECFNFLKKSIPSLEDRRTSNLGILRGSLRYIQTLRRKEREHEAEMQKLASEKIGLQGKIHSLKGELHKMNIEVDLNAWMLAHAADNESHSTSTATEGATPPPSDHGDDDDEEEADLLAMETNPSPIPKVITKKMPSVRELLNNGHTSSKVVDAIQGLMAANKVTQNSMRPLLPQPVKPTSSVGSDIPQTLTFKTTPSGQLIIPKQLKIPLSLALPPANTGVGVAKSQQSKSAPQLAFMSQMDITQTVGKTQQSTSITQQLNSALQATQQKSVPKQNVTELNSVPQQISLADFAKIQQQILSNIQKQTSEFVKDGVNQKQMTGLVKDGGNPQKSKTIHLADIHEQTKLSQLANIAQQTASTSQQTSFGHLVNISQQTASTAQQASVSTQQQNVSLVDSGSQKMNSTILANVQQTPTVAKQPATVAMQPTTVALQMVTVAQQVIPQSSLAQLANIVQQTTLNQLAEHTRTSQQIKLSQQATSQQPTNIPRPPVTQILHQTLTQRQALQKQAKSTSQVVSAPLTAAKLKSPPLGSTAVPVSMTTSIMTTKNSVSASLQSTPVKYEYIATPVNMVSTPVKVETTSSSSMNLVSLSTINQDTKNTTSIPATFSVPYYMASLPKFAHPILVTSLTAPTLAALVSTNTAMTPITTIKTEAASAAPVAMVTSSSAPLLSVNQGQTSASVQNAPLATGLQVRPLLASNLPLGPFVPLIAHTIPQTSISATPSSATITTTLSGQFTSVPIMSLAQLNPLTQIVSPVTVMSPGMQIGSAGLTQTQLNNMFATSPLLKQFSQIPIIAPSLLPSGQVLGQQVVKPVVMVTMPNMVTSAVALPTSTVMKSE